MLMGEPSARLRVSGAEVPAYDGTVTIRHVEGCALSGDFRMKFPNPDGGLGLELTGDFNAGYCMLTHFIR
jgi:hypothetical protein